ncbi:Uncharacterised protein [Mycobacterium tuberculosis]|uniref:Uncharacterized protein n=1 Tax=Mycobacterium tuberculosis TaxID=1773 RepID=A0A655AHX3_MYCTX|nr:Uncharacterised protein [Mycobacterium tuberculosis]CFE70805.1 Uncharacterised protein [Mycobacterium tuberculosis]CKS90349.1 Uncharacterised protein [Mycobacterium tuberculosis]CKT26301.1 Uncharacterised protein [Mycobacterium tuberculosis]CKT32110.1 Uncharacterised protein [Mycobacterium tuberculosis]
MRQAGIDTRAVHRHAVPAGVGHQRLRRIETHRLGAQQRRTERRRVVQLEPRRVEHQRRETQCVALGEAEIGKRLQLFVDPVDHLVGGAVQRAHAVVEPAAQPAHAFGGAFGPHGAAQLVGLGGGKAGAVDRQLHQLLLKQRHSQRLSQCRRHRRVLVDDRVDAVAPPDVGVHRSALDGPGADQRHLHHQVVEHSRLKARQGGHLRT